MKNIGAGFHIATCPVFSWPAWRRPDEIGSDFRTPVGVHRTPETGDRFRRRYTLFRNLLGPRHLGDRGLACGYPGDIAVGLRLGS